MVIFVSVFIGTFSWSSTVPSLSELSANFSNFEFEIGFKFTFTILVTSGMVNNVNGSYACIIMGTCADQIVRLKVWVHRLITSSTTHS